MKSPSLPTLVAVLTLASSSAMAQNFFERLFGIAPSRPEPPPASAPAAPGPGSDDQSKPRAAPPPVQARPTAVKAPSDDAIIGRDLKQNGTNGALRLERTSRGDMRIKLTLAGRRSAGSVETCSVAFGGPDGVPLVSQGKPDGASRFQLQSPECPLTIDVLDEAVLVKGATEVCVFQAASCQADPSGLWGPEPAKLLGKAREYEQARAAADKAVRDNYKVLAQRAGPQNVRPVVAEQAAFSSDREMVCRNYAREGSHSFCNSRFTEARGLSLATRLGVTSVAANAPPVEPRIRRQRNDAMGLPSTESLTQRPGLEPEE